MDHYQIVINGKKVSFRVAGTGQPLVLLHASPSSSAAFAGMATALEHDFTIIAPDTPGYGDSEALPEQPDSLADYAHFLRTFTRALGLQRFALYGTATGAQIAIRYALLFPEDIDHLYLDNAAHFTDELSERIIADYFPDICPRYDGSHLLTVWTMVRDLFTFFPWCWARPEYRLPMTLPPPAVLHRVALEYFTAGPNYATAYRLAFAHERAANVQALRVPTTVFHHQGSIIEPHIRALVAHDLPANVTVVTTPAAPAAKLSAMKARLLATAAATSFTREREWMPWPQPAPVPDDLPALIPDVDGAYLVKAWFYLRDRQVASGSYTLGAKEVQKELVRWMRRGRPS